MLPAVMMFEKELQEATRIAYQAGEIIRAIYQKDFSVSYKTASDPVTIADTQANECIVAELAKIFPNDGIVAEENATHGDSTKKERCWFVDPLDGTKEFIAKNGEFSVMIGLAVQGEAKLGVVYQVAKERLFAGCIGAEAYVIEQNSKQALHVSNTADPSQLRLVVSRSHRDKVIDDFMKKLGIKEDRPSGSVGVKVGLITLQEADVYVHFSDKSSRWDACAPDAILRAAGGVFLNLAGEIYRYDTDEIQNKKGIFACNQAASQKALEAAQEIARNTNFLI